MFTIGAFAHMAGLSAKTLRHYHDRDLLVPAWVDPNTGYRTYTLRQLDDAVRISVLRRGGMPIALIRVVLGSPDRAESLIRDFQEEQRQRRLEEDQALDQVANAASQEGVAAHTRRVPACPYAAVAVQFAEPAGSDPDSVVAALNARVDARAEWLRELLMSAGMAPVAEFWTVVEKDSDNLTITVHWPLPDIWGQSRVESLTEGAWYGRLPEREETFVEIPQPEHDGDASIQLAISAVLATARDGVGWGGLRQTVHRDQSTVEYALTLRELE